MPEEALGSIALAANDVIKHGSPKLKEYQSQEEQLWMVTAYVFDLARKMELIYRATRRFAQQDRADPELARLIKGQNDALHDPNLGWEEIARKLEQMMIGLFADHQVEHEQLLERAAGRAPK